MAHADDKPVMLASLRGKVRVVTMGFTRCKFACPRIFHDMQKVEAALGADADKVGFTFLSIDPQHDTPAAMAAKMAELKMSGERWTFLSAPDDTVQQLVVALNFKFQLVEGFFAHSNLIAVLDEDGNVIHREESLGADIEPTVSSVAPATKAMKTRLITLLRWRFNYRHMRKPPPRQIRFLSPMVVSYSASKTRRGLNTVRTISTSTAVCGPSMTTPGC
jgi:protein SCO1/2